MGLASGSLSENLPRRRVLKGLAVGTGLVLTGCHGWPGRPGSSGPLRGPGDRPDPRQPEGVDLLPQIEHIVVYMQENHSYDSYFGVRRRGDGYRMRQGEPQDSNPLTSGEQVRSSTPPTRARAALACRNAGRPRTPRSTAAAWTASSTRTTPPMRYWDRSDIPFYWSLAETFPSCDRWFASAPAQTYPNRMFLQAATCQDLVTTDVVRAFGMPHPAGGTIWEKLDEFGISWLDYAWDLPDIALFPSLWSARLDRVRTLPQFLADCQTGTLPAVSIVSPGVTAYTEENPRDIQLGEAYSASVINAVLASPAWPRTVLVFTYDEHGGYYDHVPPRGQCRPTTSGPTSWRRPRLRPHGTTTGSGCPASSSPRSRGGTTCHTSSTTTRRSFG